MTNVTSSLTKTQIKKALETSTVNVVVDSFTQKTRAIRNIEDKLIQGVKVCSHSPMDVLPKDVTIETKKKALANKLKELGLEKVEENSCLITFIANKGTKKEFKVSLLEMNYPTYSRSVGRDPGYTSTWIVLSYPND